MTDDEIRERLMAALSGMFSRATARQVVNELLPTVRAIAAAQLRSVADDEVAESIRELRALTECRCDETRREIGQHRDGCLTEWRTDVEVLAAAVDRMTALYEHVRRNKTEESE